MYGCGWGEEVIHIACRLLDTYVVYVVEVINFLESLSLSTLSLSLPLLLLTPSTPMSFPYRFRATHHFGMTVSRLAYVAV